MEGRQAALAEALVMLAAVDAVALVAGPALAEAVEAPGGQWWQRVGRRGLPI